MFSKANAGSRLSNARRRLEKVTTVCEAVIRYQTDARVPKKTSPWKNGLIKWQVCRVILNFQLDPAFVAAAEAAGYNIDGKDWQVNTDINPLAEHANSEEKYCRFRLKERLETYYQEPEGGPFIPASLVQEFLPPQPEEIDTFVCRIVKLRNIHSIELLSSKELIEFTD